MAAETFAYNLLGENLRSTIERNEVSKTTQWIESKFPEHSLQERLRENPFETDLKASFSDLKSDSKLEGKLLVGSVITLNNFLRSNSRILDKLQALDVDLVSGGPPCQSFSLAGRRDKSNPRNSLPGHFADFVQLIKPKFVVLENVSGILRPFKEHGRKYLAWVEVAKAFARIGYLPICLHINAKYVGAAQNRPRFLMLAIRDDIVKKFFEPKRVSRRFRELLCENLDTIKSGSWERFRCLEIEEDHDVFKCPELSNLYPKKFRLAEQWIAARDAIDDLGKSPFTPSSYARVLNKKLNPLFPLVLQNNGAPANHQFRRNGIKVQQRFHLYQQLIGMNGIYRDTIRFLQVPDSHKLSTETKEYLLSRKYLLEDQTFRKFHNFDELAGYLTTLRTKKHSQRAIHPDRPAPAALSIPDDACHHSERRTFTVREMARFQSFPDWFEFRSKITTGDKGRKFEVPQYTQVGNAVPPLLGLAIGRTIAKLYDRQSE